MLPIPSTRPERSAGAAPLRVEPLTRAEDFAALREPWNALLRESRSNCFFLSWEWLDAWWTHLHGSLTPHLILVWSGDELVGIAPLARTRAALPWLSRLEFLGTGFAGSDYLDIIVRRDREAEIAQAISNALLTSSLALHLDHLPPQSVVASTILDRLAAHAWTSIDAAVGTCPFIPLAGHSWESYLASLGSAHRANFRRRLRGLEREFDVRFGRVSSDAERRDAMATLMQLHNRRWDERGGSTAFSTPACRAFHDEVTRRALDCGWLRLYELRLNDAVAAATYCIAYDGCVYFYQGAFDDTFQQHSVGMVAMGLTIRAAIEEGAREFDMLYGVESYKWLWASQARTLHRLDLFPSDLAGRFHRSTIRAERAARSLVRRIIPRRSCTSSTRPAGGVC